MNEKILNRIRLKNFLKEVQDKDRKPIDIHEKEVVVNINNVNEYLLQTIFSSDYS